MTTPAEPLSAEFFRDLADDLKAVRRLLEAGVTAPTEAQQEFLDPKEAAVFARCSARTLERMHASGAEVGLRKVGKRTVYHRETLAAFIAGRTHRD